MAVSNSELEQMNATLQDRTATTEQFTYSFGVAEGNGSMKEVLGGKGAGVAEMTKTGLPVPPGFTIQTEACRHS